ncbi:MAG TPA: tripartite tricarboxylate transporter TctB family protein [Burkholderiales bacterium]|nr:tripartite tricarboxylate transporter TctB family protein [Burkholderiales bacterium]
MHEHRAHETDEPSVARWAVELGLAAFIALVGAVIVNGSLEQGTGWGATGPESGYFPFCIGVLITLTAAAIGASAVKTKLRAARGMVPLEVFIHYPRLTRVLQVFVPTAIYIVSVRWLGLYLASGLFVAGFMMWHGGYRWKAAAVGVGAPLFFYFVLELWFNIELYKGPLLAWLLER